MSPAFPVGRFLAVSSACFGVGYLLLKTVVPDAEQAYQNLPADARRRVDDARAKRAAWEAEMSKQIRAQRQDGPMKPIWEDDSTTPSPPA